MQRRQDWLRDTLAHEGEPQIRFIGTARLNEPITAVASRIRDTFGFTPNWAQALTTWTAALQTLARCHGRCWRDWSSRMASSGTTPTEGWIHREFRGFVLVDEYAPLVFVNGADAKTAQMFTLAHECAHLWYGQSAAFDLRELQPANNHIEIACNAVAAEFLVAETELRPAMGVRTWAGATVRLSSATL